MGNTLLTVEELSEGDHFGFPISAGGLGWGYVVRVEPGQYDRTALVCYSARLGGRDVFSIDLPWHRQVQVQEDN